VYAPEARLNRYDENLLPRALSGKALRFFDHEKKLAANLAAAWSEFF